MQESLIVRKASTGAGAVLNFEATRDYHIWYTETFPAEKVRKLLDRSHDGPLDYADPRSTRRKEDYTAHHSCYIKNLEMQYGVLDIIPMDECNLYTLKVIAAL